MGLTFDSKTEASGIKKPTFLIEISSTYGLIKSIYRGHDLASPGSLGNTPAIIIETLQGNLFLCLSLVFGESKRGDGLNMLTKVSNQVAPRNPCGHMHNLPLRIWMVNDERDGKAMTMKVIRPNHVLNCWCGI